MNRDGALDVLAVGGGAVTGTTAAGDGPRLLLGDGRGGFVDRTQAFGLTPLGFGMGVAAGDVDNDGWTDVYLTTFAGQDRLLRNVQGQRFEDVTEAWGLGGEGWSTSAAFLDLEGDGDLDLFVVRYVEYTPEDALDCWFRTNHIYCTPIMYAALADHLWVNDGTSFHPAHERLGPAGKGLAVGAGDVDGDGDIDHYVANDSTANQLYLNDGAGQLQEVAVRAGVAYSELGREEASMGVTIGDVDGDGLSDLAVTNFQGEPTSVYLRDARGFYRERSDALGIGASARARLGFGLEWLDADNDGDRDLVTVNGHVSDQVASYTQGVTFGQENSLYESVQGRFSDVSAEAGPSFARAGVSRGLAVGDLDGDGGLDLVVSENDGPLQVDRNATSGRGHWASLWLEGVTANRGAIGATVVARVGERVLHAAVAGSSSYLSVSDRRIHLGLGEATRVDELTITWPGGAAQTLVDLPADAHLYIRQGQPARPYSPGAAVLAP